MNTDTPSPQVPPALTEMIVSGPPAWRLRLVQTLQLVGVLFGMLGTADVLNVLKLLSPEFAAWLAISGVGLRFAAEPFIELVGDLADDGVLNKSFKIPVTVAQKVGLWLILAICMTFACSCTGVTAPSINLTPEGCAVIEYSNYAAGPCLGPDGKIDRYIIRYKATKTEHLVAEDGTVTTKTSTVTAWTMRYTKTGQTKMFYAGPNGVPIEYDSKSGFILSPPPAVEVTPTQVPAS